jgi:hypothetical protein
MQFGGLTAFIATDAQFSALFKKAAASSGHHRSANWRMIW